MQFRRSSSTFMSMFMVTAKERKADLAFSYTRSTRFLLISEQPLSPSHLMVLNLFLVISSATDFNFSQELIELLTLSVNNSLHVLADCKCFHN